MSNKATGSEGVKMAVLDPDERSKGMDDRIVHIIHRQIIVEPKLRL
jgi:hypothetical protein